ncbi:MAG: conjugal transfer protein TraF [Elusimicrobia bacterium]|nr:conjugal transfer protein TraF [Elusimicrobiota bacterium]
MNRLAFLVVASAVISAAPAGALEWTALGPRAMGMGGAGVAAVQGPLASYWNPAALGRETENAYGLQIPFGVHAALTGTVIEGAKNLKVLMKNYSASNLPAQASIDDALNKLNDPNDGLRIDAGAGADFKVGQVALFANGFFDMGAFPVVDLNHKSQLDIVNGTNQSKLIVKGARLLEFGAGWGHELPFVPGVFLGGNLKLMQAQVGYADYLVLQNNNDQSNILSTLKYGAKTSANFGVDLGALWDVQGTFEGAWWQPRVGLVGRNLNNPKFSQPNAATAAGVTGRYALNPQVRLGGALSPLSWWHFVSDVDLTENRTTLDSVKSRQFGAGTEVDVFNRSWINIPLRFGVARNLANTNAGTMLTGGAGLNFLHFMLDASAQYSPKRIQTQSQGGNTKLPRECAASLQLSLLFGGSSERGGRAAREPKPLPTLQADPFHPAPSDELAPGQAEKVRENAGKAQQELEKEESKH